MIILLEGGVVRLDVGDYYRLEGRSVYLGNNGYAYFSTWADGPITLHSFVLGGAREGYHIDHINGDKLDNRRRNLRFVSYQGNQVNRKKLNKNNTSGVRGVRKSSASKRNPWLAQIMVDRRAIHLGLFPTEQDAIGARKSAEIRYYGEECP